MNTQQTRTPPPHKIVMDVCTVCTCRSILTTGDLASYFDKRVHLSNQFIELFHIVQICVVGIIGNTL